MTEKRKYKVVLIGPCAVGKTNMISRFNSNEFYTDCDSTVGVSYITSNVKIDDGSVVTLRVWDTAGQEKYKCLLPMYSRGSAAIVAVFDLSNMETAEDAKEWIEKNEGDQGDAVFFIVGNKNDLPYDEQGACEVHAWAEEKGIKYMETSAKTGENIEMLFQEVAEAVSARTMQIKQQEVPIANEKGKCC